MDQDPLRPARVAGVLALLGIGIGCFLVVRPFISALLWAAILVYTTWPAFRLLRERLGLSPGWAALVMVLTWSLARSRTGVGRGIPTVSASSTAA